MVSGTLNICRNDALVVIDPEIMHSFVSFATLTEECLWPSQMLKRCLFYGDLIMLDLYGLDVILSMN